MNYRIIDTDGNEIARVAGDVVATTAVVVVTPQEDHISQADLARISAAFREYGIKAIVCNHPLNVVQVFQPEE